ncbi:GDP-mannose 4,6-dehydratase [Gammaproteobacteria bacterium]|nr:GDP-mannose 4,6-dehydratase [Gammaproteobacteria bacterium]
MTNFKKIILTGGCGFIGSAMVRKLIQASCFEVLNIDSLTYSGDLQNVESVSDEDNYRHCKLDIVETERLFEAIDDFKPDAIIHFAAESHVDKSIEDPSSFIRTNICGTYSLLSASLKYWFNASSKVKKIQRMSHEIVISTII